MGQYFFHHLDINFDVFAGHGMHNLQYTMCYKRTHRVLHSKWYIWAMQIIIGHVQFSIHKVIQKNTRSCSTQYMGNALIFMHIMGNLVPNDERLL